MYADGLVTKDQIGWGFTVQQDAAPIRNDDRAAYTVSATSLTMEVEAVTHYLHWIASRGNSQTTHAIILTDSLSLLQKVEREAQTGISHCLTSTFENWMYGPERA